MAVVMKIKTKPVSAIWKSVEYRIKAYYYTQFNVRVILAYVANSKSEVNGPTIKYMYMHSYWCATSGTASHLQAAVFQL